MPSLSQASPAQWARMRASTRLDTYQVMERLRAEGGVARNAITVGDEATWSDLVQSGWVEVDAGGMVSLTPAGLAHLAA